MEKKQIRIMHMVHSLNEGGIERLLLELCSKINKKQFDIQVCCLVEKGTIAHEFEKIGIRLHLMKARRDFRLTNIIPNLIELYKVSKLLKREKIDITHGHEFFSTVFSRIAAALAGVGRRYITLHNVYYWWSPVVHKTQKLLSFMTTKIICNSQATLDYSVKHDEIKKEKYLLIYNGIDCNRFSPKDLYKCNSLFKEFSLTEDKIICMSVGSISPRKGFSCLIKAAEILREKMPSLIFFIVGDKHHQEYYEYRNIETLINQLGLGGRVFITGNRNNVNELLNLCDIYIMPSQVEGFGLALIEAMAVKRVCIASDIDPFKEIVDDGKDGFLFKSMNEYDLAGKVEEVLSMNKECREKIGNNARTKVLRNFSSEAMISKYEKLYLQ